MIHSAVAGRRRDAGRGGIVIQDVRHGSGILDPGGRGPRLRLRLRLRLGVRFRETVSEGRIVVVGVDADDGLSAVSGGKACGQGGAGEDVAGGDGGEPIGGNNLEVAVGECGPEELVGVACAAEDDDAGPAEAEERCAELLGVGDVGDEAQRAGCGASVEEKATERPRDEDGGLRRVKRTFPWVDVAVADGLYPNGPFLTAVQELGMGAVVIVRKETDEPLKEALTIWGASPPEEVIDVPREHADGRQLHGVERISLWDCKGIETLDTYRGPIRVVRAEIQDPEKPGDQRRTWIMAVTGRWPTARLTALKVLQVARGRWHIENTGFHQWTTRWKFAHVFVHNGNALLALFSLFFAAYNLLTLYLYRQVRSYGRDRGKCPTRTISRFIDELLDDLARLALPQDSS